MTQVNLLPSELRAREATRRLTSVVVIVGVLVLGLVGLFYFFQVMNLSRARDDLAAQEGVNSQLQAQVNDLQRFQELQNQLEAKQALVDSVSVSEVSWSTVLVDISQVIPSDAYLTSLTGSIAGATATPTPTPTTGGTTLIGNISFTGVVRETDPLATWLTRLEQVDGWENAWMTSATEQAPFSRIYTFNSGVDLSVEATTGQGKGLT
jgi:Tfp pilus assembly protein PilN